MAAPNQEALEPPPRKSMDDPGAHELESSESDDHFSDAQSGRNSGVTSPVPITRVEKVDDKPSYGEVPGTAAYNMRGEDSAPDEIAVIRDTTNDSQGTTSASFTAPGGQPIPSTVVERTDDEPSYGEVPGTAAHEKRAADAVPDMIVKTGERSRSSSSRSRADSTPGDLPIPITKVERVDSEPCHGEVPGTSAYELRKRDAQPDIMEEIEDDSGSPTSTASRSPTVSHARRKSSGAGKKGELPATEDNDGDDDGSDGGFADDFDDFEEGEEDAEFGDFDDGFQEAAVTTPPTQSVSTPQSFPILDFSKIDSPAEIQAAAEPHVNAVFPLDTIDVSVLPPTNAEHPVFFTPRSASLWTQLVAPPPLQPPNWIRSRIRRLFLVSLGVPVDLDEILPASKQKKLVLPSINLSTSAVSPRTSSDSRSVSRLKQGDGNRSSTSVDSQGKASRSSSRRRKGPPPAPVLDLVTARQLCTITNEALDGLTLEELKEHIQKLEAMEVTAKEILEFWTTRTDEKLGDREAFEGVIENLVKHARKVRK